jgi:hypothetical protein
VTAPGASGSPKEVTVTQAPPPPSDAVLTISTISNTPPGAVVLPVYATNVVNMGSFQFSIEYDVTKLSFISCTEWYTGITAVSVGEPIPGHITFVWAGDTGGINIADGTFFNLNFNNSNGISPIIWSDNPTLREFADWDGNIFVPTYIDGSVVTVGIEKSEHQYVQVYPNPTSNFVDVKCEFQIQNVEIMSCLGEIGCSSVSHVEVNHFRINVSSLMPGLYFAKITTDHGSKIVKITVIN